MPSGGALYRMAAGPASAACGPSSRSISGLDARGRLAMMVLDFYTRLSRRKLITGRMYNLPLTQIQIGNYLGLTVVHINRVLRSLRDDRIVNLEKHCVTIFDLARLTSLARNE